MAQACSASTIQLKDGRTLRGRVGTTSGLAENPNQPNEDAPATITFIDDDLRRTFVPTTRIREILEAESGEVLEKIRIYQRVAKAGRRVGRAGPITVEPFDKMGRRTITMRTDEGPVKVIQGITEITPVWTKVEGLANSNRPSVIWDMRIATSSLPRETLDAILTHVTNPKVLDERLRVVRLLLQAERYKDAESKLQAVIKDFPERKDLSRTVRAVRQLYARTIVSEIEVRSKAGQHALAFEMLEKFPTEDVASETLQQVREMRDDYLARQKQLERLQQELKTHVAAIANEGRKAACEEMLAEMNRELGFNTMPRMVDYLRLADDESLGAEQKISLAISGWLLGPEKAEPNLAVTLSLVKVRDVVKQYLNEPAKLERERLLDELKSLEGASPGLVAGLIATMKPPTDSPEPSPGKPDFYQFSVPVGVPDEPDATYYVQLPPKYDPHVRYPTIVTLGALGASTEQQIDWWCGGVVNGQRLGQATRLGYIVVAVEWFKEGQREYQFSAREHAAVLVSLRDACRRFSIDTDRVYLSGHSSGGDAAWDIGLAHPDLWAGVIPIVAEAQKYCPFYKENAAMVPFYFVTGELDGEKTVINAPSLDAYLMRRYDVTVTEYIGRGHDDFYEEILRIFDWMGRRRRDFYPKEFEVSTMRSFDNYFWWFEAREFPERVMVDPNDWPPKRGTRPMQIKGRVLPTGALSLTCGSVRPTLWLSPELVNFDERVPISLNGKAIKSGGVQVAPDLGVLLEDARTRADRQHPFWAKLEL